MTWLTCVDHINGGGTYILNPRHVVYVRRSKDGWWHAIDISGSYHVIASGDDGKVEALLKGQQT